MKTMGEKTKGEQVLEIKGKTTTVTVKDISPAGVKLEVNDTAEVKGKYRAAHMETTSVWLKPDGTSEWEGKGIESTPEGDFISVTGKGTGKTTGPSTQSWEGELHFSTQSPRLSWLNGWTGWVEGWGDLSKGEFQGKIYQKK